MGRKRSSPGDDEAWGRQAANARERARMRVLARAFSRLKTTLPWVPPDTKLSKLDTLRLASTYIAHLRATLYHQPQPPQPIQLNWPFGFQKVGMDQDQDDSREDEYHHQSEHHHYQEQQIITSSSN
uniref:HLH54F n=1 Tax=Aquarius paludum TaxID=95691 RepID=A0A4Q8KEX0_AQUPA|nr:HLH54F [Aquarius paludum]